MKSHGRTVREGELESLQAYDHLWPDDRAPEPDVTEEEAINKIVEYIQDEATYDEIIATYINLFGEG